jgi:flagellar protein FlaG
MQDDVRLPRTPTPVPDGQAQKKEAAIQGRTPAMEASTPQEMEKTVQQLNQTAETFNIGLRFKLHEETDRVMVQVVDTKANEVIKEIPPENLLRLAAQIQDMIGLLLDTKR